MLLIMLWFKSYWRFNFYYPPAVNAQVTSRLGVVGIQAMDAHEKSMLQSIATILSLSVAEPKSAALAVVANCMDNSRYPCGPTTKKRLSC